MAIPTEIESAWNFLHGEVTWLHGRWYIYRQLYGTSEYRIEALNKVAPTFFGSLQDILVDDVQLTLSRLADPAQTGRFQNLTLETLAQEIMDAGHKALAADLLGRLGDYRDKCRAILERRNKRLAHYDRVTHEADRAEALRGPSRAEIESALDSLRIFMRRVHEYFEHSYMAYEQFVLQTSAENLIYAIARALRYAELVDSGKIDFVDLFESDAFRRLRNGPA